MGEALARHIEESFNLSTNAMDSRSLNDELVARHIEGMGWEVNSLMRSHKPQANHKGMLPDLVITKDDMLCYVEVASSKQAALKWQDLAEDGEVILIKEINPLAIDVEVTSYVQMYKEKARNNFTNKGADLGSDLARFQIIEGWDSNTPLHPDDVEIPLYKEVEMAAGGGTSHSVEINGRKLRFALSTLRAAGVDPHSAACATVTGNSMERLIMDGATIGIDRSRTQIKDGKIYAIDHCGMLRVKSLYRAPGGGLRLHSENDSEHPDEIYTAEQVASDIKILGWVFWWSQIAIW